MERLAGRITRSYDELTTFFARVAEASELLAVYEHKDKGIRTHCHFYLENLTCKTDTLKNWVKKALGVKEFAPSDWEFATKISKGIKKGQSVDRDALIYFHKGKYEVKLNKGFSEEFIEEQHKKSYSPENNIVGIKRYVTIQETPKERKKRQFELLQDMKKLYGEMTDQFNYEKAVRCVLKVHRDNQLLVNEYKVKEYVLTMMDDGALVRRLTSFCEPRV